MNEERLRQQYEQSGNLLDVLRDPEMLQEMIQAEEACGATIGAGFPAYSETSRPVDPERLKGAMRQVRLQSILFSELEVFMEKANLGAGTEAAIAEARRRIRQQLSQLTEEQQRFLDAVVAEEQLPPSERSLRPQLQAKLHSFLTPADWDAIGKAASEAIQTQWAEFISVG
jgi:hypothetical protein